MNHEISSWMMRSGKASLSGWVLSWHLKVKNMTTIQRWRGNKGGQIGISGICQVLEMWTRGPMSLRKIIYHLETSQECDCKSFQWHIEALFGSPKGRSYSYKNVLLCDFAIYYLLRTQTLWSYLCKIYIWCNDFYLEAKITLKFMIYFYKGLWPFCI